MRPCKREANEMRPVVFDRHYTKHAEGSVLSCFGDTKVLCTASIVEGVPRFLKDKKQGWLTAEYGMLPRSTHERMNREAARGKQGGRTVEIQRLIGRSLRSMLDFKRLGEFTVTVDCDVIQADGGTRTAAISGACVAVVDALNHMQRKQTIQADPLLHMVSAVSVGIVDGAPVLDLAYEEDSSAETDMNVVMTSDGRYVEVQGTAEGVPFSPEEFNCMLALAKEGIDHITQKQQAALAAGE